MSLKVDLKSQEIRRGVSFDFGWIVVLIVVLAAFVAFYVGGLRLQSVADSRKKELQTWKDKVAGFSGIQGKLDQLKNEIVSIQGQITQMRELRYDPLRYSLLLVRLSKLLPSNVWLTSLSIEPSQTQVMMAGQAGEQAGKPPLASSAEFLRNLQDDQNNYFFDTVLQSTTASGKSGETWTFTLQTKYNIPLIRSGAQSTPSPAPQTAPTPQNGTVPPSPKAVAPAAAPPAGKEGSKHP